MFVDFIVGLLISSLKKLLPQEKFKLHLLPEQEDFVDVKDLMKSLTDEQLIQSANDYWDGIGDDSLQVFKPFGDIVEPTYQTRALSVIFKAANLFEGAKVLDFGCATGWLTIALSEMGLDAHGVDVAKKAIALAKKSKKNQRTGSSVQFKDYDGHTLPYPDSSFDRIICFDTFHHVKNIEATIIEMARVLKPGGRIIMSEPYFGHSRAVQSQNEMRNFNVIENDLDMREVARLCRANDMTYPTFLLLPNELIECRFEDNEKWNSDEAMHNNFMEKLSLQSPHPAGLMFYIEKWKDEQFPCVYSFKENVQNKNSMAMEGFCSPEAWGSWIVSQTARLTLPLDIRNVSGLRVSITCRSFTPKMRRILKAKIIVNGKLKINKMFFNSSEQELVFTLDRAELAGFDCIVFDFEFSPGKSPFELGLGPDQRRLELGISSIEVSSLDS